MELCEIFLHEIRIIQKEAFLTLQHVARAFVVVLLFVALKNIIYYLMNGTSSNF